jgi:16S rRNA (uracil1498-N3)-methyltransferase
MKRLVLPGLDLDQDQVELTQNNARYVARILRLQAGDRLLLCNGQGAEGEATLTSVSPKGVLLHVDSRRQAQPPDHPPLRLVQAVPRAKNKMSDIIRQATELSVAVVQPVLSERSVARPPAPRQDKQAERWRRIATEASRQCRRPRLPDVAPLCPLGQALGDKEDHLGIMLWEGESSQHLADILGRQPLDQGVSLVIGPEGGFTEDEAALAREQGFHLASLGPSILRLETAAIAACAITQLYLGALRKSPT